MENAAARAGDSGGQLTQRQCRRERKISQDMRRMHRQTIAVVAIADLRMRIRHGARIGMGMGLEVGMANVPNAREHEQAEQEHSKGAVTADTGHERIMAWRIRQAKPS